MKTLLDLLEKGGPVMIAIVGLSVVLYAQCFQLLLTLRRQSRCSVRNPPSSDAQLAELRGRATALRETFHQQRIFLGAMIAAAPLLGLLGTVSGMMKTFESLATQSGQKSMEGLAGGISEVLVATESGLAVAIPALLFVYLAHREMHRCLQDVQRYEQTVFPREAA